MTQKDLSLLRVALLVEQYPHTVRIEDGYYIVSLIREPIPKEVLAIVINAPDFLEMKNRGKIVNNSVDCYYRRDKEEPWWKEYIIPRIHRLYIKSMENVEETATRVIRFYLKYPLEAVKGSNRLPDGSDMVMRNVKEVYAAADDLEKLLKCPVTKADDGAIIDISGMYLDVSKPKINPNTLNILKPMRCWVVSIPFSRGRH